MFLECVATDPKFTPALVELGVLAIRSKDGTAEAHKHLLAAHATFSDFVSSELSNSIPATVDLKLKGAAMHVCLAEVYKRYGDTLKQRRHLEFAVGLTPNNAAVRLALAELHLRGRQYESAVTQLLEVLSLKPHDRVTKTLLKNVYLGQALDCSERSDAYGAIAAYDKCLPLLDSDVHSSQGVEVRYNLAALHESVGNTMKALSLYRDAVGMDRSHWRARVALASLCHKLSQTSPSDAPRLQDEAIRLYTEALENDGCKEKDRVLYGLGLLYIARQEAERASEKFRAALTINPSLKEARLELSNVLLSEGNSGGAVYHLEEALRVDPNYGAARHNLYQINQRAAADKGKEGGDNFDMNKLEAGTRDALVAVGTAELAGRRGDFAAALSGYEKHLPTIAMVSDEYPALKEGLGAAYWNQVHACASPCLRLVTRLCVCVSLCRD